MRWDISFDELAGVLQIIRGIGIIFFFWGGGGVIIHIYRKTIFCDPSLEPSRRDGSN